MMMEKVIGYQKSEIKDKSLNSSANLEEIAYMDLLTSISQLDSNPNELALKKVPKLLKQTKQVLKTNQKTVKQTSKLSKQTKKYYYKVSKAIIKLLKKDELPQELKLELIKLLNEITLKIEACDERDKYFFGEQHKKTISYGSVAFLTLAAIYGVVASKKS